MTHKRLRSAIGAFSKSCPTQLADEPELRKRLEHKVSRAQYDVDGPSPGTFFILSAAAHWDLLAMWRCYGGLGESYAIGLDPSVSLQILCNADAPSPFGERRIIRCRPWTPVRYGPQEHRALAEAVFEGLSDDLAALRARVEREGQMDQAAIVEELAETVDDVEQALVLAKHEGFSDEREVRHTVSLLTDPGSPGWPGLVR
jgi:hypothetical protein